MAYPRDPNFGAYPDSVNDPRRVHLPQYRFSRDELRVIKECNRESFYQRCLPLMSVFGLGTYYAVKSGYLKSNLSGFGAVPKVLAATVLGFIIGKISYKAKCEEKILALSDSRLKDAILARKLQQPNLGSALKDTLTMDESFAASMMPFGSAEIFSDEGKSIAELDTDRPMNLLDDGFRSHSSLPEHDLDNLPAISAPAHSVTYEELRRKNREQYDDRRSMPHRRGYLDDIQPYSSPAGPQKPLPPRMEGGDQQPYPESAQRSLYAGQPSAYGSQPAPYGGQPAPYGGQPAPYGGQPAPYGGQPAPYGGQPAPYGGQPAPYGGQPAPYGGQPAPYGGQSPSPHSRLPSQRKNLYGDILDK